MQTCTKREKCSCTQMYPNSTCTLFPPPQMSKHLKLRLGCELVQARVHWFKTHCQAAVMRICRVICSLSESISPIFKCNTHCSSFVRSERTQEFCNEAIMEREPDGSSALLTPSAPTSICPHNHTHKNFTNTRAVCWRKESDRMEDVEDRGRRSEMDG